VKASVKMDNFVAGRLILGRVCHTLQVGLGGGWMDRGMIDAEVEDCRVGVDGEMFGWMGE